MTRRVDDAYRLFQHLGLDGLALCVEVIELAGDLRGLVGIAGGQQARAQRGFADPAAGVDPRPEDEPGVIFTRLLGYVRGKGQVLDTLDEVEQLNQLSANLNNNPLL